MKKLLLLSFLITFSLSYSQVNFFKMYGEDEYDYGHSIVQLEDGNYVIAGASGSFQEGNSQAFLLKLDTLGNYIWSVGYGGPESESAEKLLYKQNVGFFIAGYTSSYGNGAFDMYISKIDLNGQQQWEKTYGTADWEKAVDMAFTRDTGMVIIGEIRGDSTENSDIMIMRVDQNGDSLWSQTVGWSGDDRPTSIESFQDTMFVITANRYIEDSLNTRAYMFLIHEDGTMLWEDTLSTTVGYFELNDFFISNDTIYGIGAHRKNDTMAADIRYYRYKIQNGAINHIQDFSVHSADDWFGDLITDYGNNTSRYGAYRVEAFWSSPGGPDLHVGRHVYTLGWAAGVGIVDGVNPDIGRQAIPTLDGGAAIVGYTSSNGSGGSSVFLMKIGPNEVYPTIQGVTYVFNLVDVEEVIGNSAISVYPNPANDKVIIEGSELNGCVFELIDMTGKVLQKHGVNSGEPIDVSTYSPGVYLINIISEGALVGSYKLMID